MLFYYILKALHSRGVYILQIKLILFARKWLFDILINKYIGSVAQLVRAGDS